MKTVYKCEKCGKEFDDFDACWAHERRHITPETIQPWHYPTDHQPEPYEYTDCRQLAPTTIYLKYAETDAEGKELRDDEGRPTYRVLAYKLSNTRDNADARNDIETALNARGE